MSNIPELPPSITLTKLAAKMIASTMKDDNLDLQKNYLRVGILGGGCSGLQYQLDFTDSPGELDQIFEQHGIKIAIDYFSASHLFGTVINYADSLNGAGFKFENPSKNLRTCGCGQSFGYN